MAFPIEGDGLLDNLFYYVWLKAARDEGLRGFFLPDTVVYKYQQPRSWYFTSIDGTIKKKCKDKLTTQCIEEAFLKKKSESGIVACYIFMSASNNRVIEFFGSEELKHFLNYRKKAQEGILQKWIDPKGEKNSIIQMVWSPKICLFEYRENLKDLYDQRYDMYERAVTFEGEEFHSSSITLRGNELKKHLKNIVELLVMHISEVTSNKLSINRMVLHFKQDKYDNLWLLRATSIRCSEHQNSPLDLNSVIKLPETVNGHKFSTNPQCPMALQKTVLCRNCEEAMEADRMCEISYRMIITAQDGIPPLLKKIHSHMTIDEFEKFRHNPLFLNKQTLVCDQCFLIFTNQWQTSGALPRPQSVPIFGTQPLDPKKTNRRREVTLLSRPENQYLERTVKSSKSTRAFRPNSAAGGELQLAFTSFRSEIPKIPALNLPRPRTEQHLRGQVSLARMLGTVDITSFLEERYSNKRRQL